MHTLDTLDAPRGVRPGGTTGDIHPPLDDYTGPMAATNAAHMASPYPANSGVTHLWDVAVFLRVCSPCPHHAPTPHASRRCPPCRIGTSITSQRACPPATLAMATACLLLQRGCSGCQEAATTARPGTGKPWRA